MHVTTSLQKILFPILTVKKFALLLPIFYMTHLINKNTVFDSHQNLLHRKEIFIEYSVCAKKYIYAAIYRKRLHSLIYVLLL